MNLVFEITTKSNSVYKLLCSRDRKTVILLSDSPAFKNIDFILLSKLYITERLSFFGVLYSNAVVSNNGKISKRYPDKGIFKMDMNTEQFTTAVEGIKIVNKRLFDKLSRENIINTRK